MTEKWGNRKRQKYKIKENEGDKTLLVVLVLLSYRGKRINDRFSPRRFMWMKDNRLMHRIISSGQIIGSGPEGGEALSLLRRYPTDTINPDDKLQVDSAGRRAHAELRIDRQNMTGVDKKKSASLFSMQWTGSGANIRQEPYCHIASHVIHPQDKGAAVQSESYFLFHRVKESADRQAHVEPGGVSTCCCLVPSSRHKQRKRKRRCGKEKADNNYSCRL